MHSFDIAPFGLPNCEPGEVRFEEPRDVDHVVVTFAAPAPRRVGLSYLGRIWPEHRHEMGGGVYDMTRPARFGWIPIDDHFNTKWRKAAVNVERLSDRKLMIRFRPLHKEKLADFPEPADYNVAFRRTLGLRVDAGARAKIRRIQVFTTSKPARTRLRVELDAGRKTSSKRISLSSYNAKVAKVEPARGVRSDGADVVLRSASRRGFHLTVGHMQPAHR